MIQRELKMYTRTITVENAVGLRARPATLFIQKANAFESSVWIESSDRRANGKSLLGVLSLGVKKGDTVTIMAEGDDEEDTVNSLVNLVLSIE